MKHLFFECSNAKVVWGNLGEILGTPMCPLLYGKLWHGFISFIPKGGNFICCFLLPFAGGFGLLGIK
jgi:hypothetical protein